MTDELHRKLAKAGVFKGFEGLEGLANSESFWDEQSYGTRLYYGPGITDYLHRGVLRAAIEILKKPAVQQEAPPWIPLTERLPSWTPGGGDTPVLLWLGPDVLADDCPAHRHVVSNPEYAAKTALKAGYTHWMPLHEGPKS